MIQAARILMVVTSHGDIDDRPTTGVWFSEFSEPFDAFIESGAVVTVASPKGGPAPVDPRGYPEKEKIAGVRDALAALNATVHLAAVAAGNFEAIFFPGRGRLSWPGRPPRRRLVGWIAAPRR
jgi:putative intracellular protease/amidase